PLRDGAANVDNGLAQAEPDGGRVRAIGFDGDGVAVADTTNGCRDQMCLRGGEMDAVARPDRIRGAFAADAGQVGEITEVVAPGIRAGHIERDGAVNSSGVGAEIECDICRGRAVEAGSDR